MNDPEPTPATSLTPAYQPDTMPVPSTPAPLPQPIMPPPPDTNWAPPPAARPARTLAALLVLVIVFAIGVAVGSTGALGRTGVTNGGSGSGSTGAPSGQGSGQSPSASGGAPFDFDLFNQALNVIEQNYVGRANLDAQALTWGAIRGMVQSLGDTGHTVFLTPSEAQQEQNALDQNVVGIGVLLGEKDGQSIIVSVVPDSPAQAAGLKAGDVITQVNGTSTQGMTPDQLVDLVRGDEGTQVQLTVERPSTGETLNFDITRAKINFPSVSWTMVPGTDIALIRFSQFAAGSADELKAARDAALAAGANSIILDLRGNPGGYVDQAVKASSLFLDDGKTVYIRELADGEHITVTTDPAYQATQVPVVVLVDNNTASSAEIMSGALQDAGRAQIVGEQTFGTGTVLLPFTLPDGSVIRLAIERWLTPNGELIFGKGITPDYVIALGQDDVPIEPNDLSNISADQLTTISDVQLLQAISLLGGPAYSPPPSAQPVATP